MYSYVTPEILMLPLHVDMTQQQMTYTENLTGLLPCEVQA